MADGHQQFLDLLSRLLSVDNESRLEAEGIYEQTPVETRLGLLLQVIGNAETTLDIRCLSAVLMRRIYASEYEDISKLQPEILSNVRSNLLQITINVEDDLIRKKLCDLIAEVARSSIESESTEHGWPEVLQFLISCVQSDNPKSKEMGMTILSFVPSIFGVLQYQNLNVIKQMITQCLSDSKYEIKMAGAKALCQFLIANDEDKNLINTWRTSTLDLLLQALSENISADDDLNVLKNIVEVADACPIFFRPRFQQLISACTNLISDDEKNGTVRHLALELIVTMAESAGSSMRKLCSVEIPLLVQKLLAQMTTIEHDDEEWNVIEEADDEESDATSAETSLDRLSCALGARTMAPLIMAGVKQLLGNQTSWESRHAGLMALSACGEGCKLYFEKNLKDIMTAVLPFLQDSHPRVRYAACNAVGQMCSDFGPNLQKTCHSYIMPGLLTLLSNETIPKVQSHAAAAIVNFCEDSPPATILPYLDNLLTSLEHLLQRCSHNVHAPGSKMVLEQIVMTLASVADSSEEKFIPYYERFTPGLIQIIQQTSVRQENGPDFRLLRGKTIECVSFIGLAVGKEKFNADAERVMELLLSANKGVNLEDDDPQLPYLIGAWARMAKILGGQAFEKYLPLVMPPVMKAAELKPEVALLDQEEIEEYEDTDEWQVVNMGEQQRLAIKTAGMEDKANAFQMIVSYLKELKGHLDSYLEDIAKLMVGHLRFYFHELVRIYAAESMPMLLDCAKDLKGNQAMATMWTTLIGPELLKSAESEPEIEVKCELLHSLADCIEKCGKNCLTQEQTVELTNNLNAEIDKHMKNEMEREEKRRSNNEDYDQDVEEELDEENSEAIHLLEQISNVFHAFVGIHKEESFAFIEALINKIEQLLNGGSTGKSWSDRHWGICMIDDVIEHCGESSVRYRPMFINFFMDGILDEHAEIRQAVSYGIGVMALNAPVSYKDVCLEVLPKLLSILQNNESRNVECALATDNVLSAVTKIMKTFAEHIPMEDVLQVWVNSLPVQEDEEEAVHVYDYLCDMHSMLFSSTEATMQCVSAIGHCFYNKLLNSDDASSVKMKLLQLLGYLQTNNSDLLKLCAERMEENYRVALMEAMQ